MLEEIGVTVETPTPDEGVIQRRPGSEEPNGVLEENAMYLVMKKTMPTPEQAMEMIGEGLRHYAEAGITTAQDCATFTGTWHILAAMEKAGMLPIDVITWPVYKAIDNKAFEAIVAGKGATGVFAWAESSSSRTAPSRGTPLSSPSLITSCPASRNWSRTSATPSRTSASLSARTTRLAVRTPPPLNTAGTIADIPA